MEAFLLIKDFGSPKPLISSLVICRFSLFDLASRQQRLHLDYHLHQEV